MLSRKRIVVLDYISHTLQIEDVCDTDMTLTDMVTCS